MTIHILTDEVACNFPNEIVAFGGKRSAVDCYILADIVPSFAKPVLECLPIGCLIRAVKRKTGNTRYLSRPLGIGRLRHGVYTERHSEENRGESCFNHDRLLLVRQPSVQKPSVQKPFVQKPFVQKPFAPTRRPDDVSGAVTKLAPRPEAWKSDKGHSRHFDSGPATSALPRITDIARPGRLVRFVPERDIGLTD
jgi:hypothetical protein